MSSLNSDTSLLLKKFFDKKKTSNPNYSLRSMAKKLQISPTFLSNILNGKKPLPPKRKNDFLRILEMDDYADSKLTKSIIKDVTGFKILNSEPSEKDNGNISENFLQFELANRYHTLCLNQWYKIALLDLTTCTNFHYDLSWISKKLSISPTQVKSAINDLLQEGLLIKEGKSIRKSSSKLAFTSLTPTKEIQNYHRQMILKSKEMVNGKKNSPQEIKQRAICGITTATNPENIDQAKQILQDALYKISTILSQGNCTEVYQLNFHLFPLTKSREDYHPKNVSL